MLLQQGHAITVILCDKVGDPHRHLVLAVQQTVSPVIYLVIIRLSVVDEHGHAVDELGDQHAHQQVDQQDSHRLRQQNAEKPQDASGVLRVLFGKNPLPRSVEYPLDPVHHRRQQVCDDRAVYHRRQHGGQLAHELLQCTAHIKCVVKNQHGADGQKRRQPPLQVLCPVLHAHHSFSGLVPPIIADQTPICKGFLPSPPLRAGCALRTDNAVTPVRLTVAFPAALWHNGETHCTYRHIGGEP